MITTCRRIQACPNRHVVSRGTHYVKPGGKGSPESEHTRQEGALGIWVERMTYRNQSVTHPALKCSGDPRCVNGSRMVEGSLICWILPAPTFLIFWEPTVRGARSSNNASPCRPVKEIGRVIDWHPTTPSYQTTNQGTRVAHRLSGRDSLRLMWQRGSGGTVVVRGRESRPHGEGFQFGFRDCELAGHDMRKHHAKHS